MIDNTTTNLLGAWKRFKGLASDYAAAQALGVKHPTVSSWKHGNSHASPALAARMAEDLGLDVLSVLAAIEADRAKVADDQRVWRRFGKPAFMALLAAALGLSVAHPNVNAKPRGPMSVADHATECPILTEIERRRGG